MNTNLPTVIGTVEYPLTADTEVLADLFKNGVEQVEFTPALVSGKYRAPMVRVILKKDVTPVKAARAMAFAQSLSWSTWYQEFEVEEVDGQICFTNWVEI